MRSKLTTGWGSWPVLAVRQARWQSSLVATRILTKCRHYWPWGVKKKESEGLGVLEWDNELLPIEDRKAIQWTVGQDYSEKHFYSQVLIGDSTDNIPGCPGVGAVGATKIVNKFDTAEPVECWQEIVWAYEKAFTKKGDVRKPEVVALQQAQPSANTSSW